MQADLLITNIGQLATCAAPRRAKRRSDLADIGMITNAAVAISEGRIVSLGSTDEISGKYQSENVINAHGKAVTPGFVDPHTHIVYAGDRLNEFELKIKGTDYLDILAAGGGIISTVKATREASIEALVEQSLKRLDKMLACGTTTCEIKTGYGLDLETELKMLDAIAELDRRHPVDIVPTILAAHTIPPEFKDRSDDYIDLVSDKWLLSFWNWYTASDFFGKTSCFVDIFCERSAFSIAQTQRLIDGVENMKGHFGFKAHVDQFNNLGGSRLAIEFGAVSIDHLDKISDEEIKLLAASDTIGVVIPTENFSGGKTEFADARKLIDSGCAVAISTDFNPGSAPCPSQPMAMAIACRYQKLLPSEALNAATINAAFAIQMQDKVGSLEVGKQADLIIWDINDYRQIVYEFGGSMIQTVVKNGKIVLEA